jgi:hypothetical protein
MHLKFSYLCHPWVYLFLILSLGLGSDNLEKIYFASSRQQELEEMAIQSGIA